MEKPEQWAQQRSIDKIDLIISGAKVLYLKGRLLTFPEAATDIYLDVNELREVEILRIIWL